MLHMTVLRASRDALRGRVVASMLGVFATFALVAATPAATALASTTPGPDTTVQVASAAPVPVPAAAGSPRVGPLDAGVGGAPGRGVWWLFGLGGLQVAGLFIMTRRSRARLSVPGPAS